VEDHENTLLMLTRILRRAGHEVMTAGNVQTAIAAIGSQQFDSS
jgi:DNA-binding response OmpR family regulator